MPSTATDRLLLAFFLALLDVGLRLIHLGNRFRKET